MLLWEEWLGTQAPQSASVNHWNHRLSYGSRQSSCIKKPVVTTTVQLVLTMGNDLWTGSWELIGGSEEWTRADKEEAGKQESCAVCSLWCLPPTQIFSHCCSAAEQIGSERSQLLSQTDYSRQWLNVSVQHGIFLLDVNQWLLIYILQELFGLLWYLKNKALSLDVLPFCPSSHSFIPLSYVFLLIIIWIQNFLLEFPLPTIGEDRVECDHSVNFYW